MHKYRMKAGHGILRQDGEHNNPRALRSGSEELSSGKRRGVVRWPLSSRTVIWALSTVHVPRSYYRTCTDVSTEGLRRWTPQSAISRLSLSPRRLPPQRPEWAISTLRSSPLTRSSRGAPLVQLPSGILSGFMVVGITLSFGLAQQRRKETGAIMGIHVLWLCMADCSHVDCKRHSSLGAVMIILDLLFRSSGCGDTVVIVQSHHSTFATSPWLSIW